MLTQRTKFIAMFAPVAILIPFAADAQLTRSGSPDLSFVAKGTAGLTITGKTSELSVTDNSRSVVVKVPLDGLATGISLRDKHMKDYLEASKYPAAELEVVRSSIKFPGPGQEASADADGTLKLHGVSRPVKVHYRAKRNGDTYAVNGSLHVNMNDYEIKVPSYLGITVKPDVDVSVRFDAVDK